MSSTQAQIQRAAAEISSRTVVPDIDFTQHRLEDGTNVSTQERVIKDVREPSNMIYLRAPRCRSLDADDF